jgi:CheY-like chemotaxis protein/signal transduction histidine kinase
MNSVPRSKLLVVDDQPINIQILYQMFEGEHQVLMATSGEQALRLCRKHLPDLILLDVVMPGMDGHEVCRQLKADPLTSGIPIIFVTAQNQTEQEAHGLELGAADFISKPLNDAVVRARVKAHLRLARWSALLGATVEATADGMLVMTPDAAIVSMNGNFIRMWSIPADWVSRKDYRDVLPLMQSQVVDPTVSAQGMSQVLSEQSCGALRAFELKGDRHFECLVTALEFSGRSKGKVFSFRDVTERHRTTLQLKQLNESLESRISERTQALAIALQHADAANHAKRDFLANMSHEIRTPLNGVIGMAHLALRADPPPLQRDYIEKILRSGKHLLGIVSQILDFSKIDAGKLQLEDKRFELSAIFNSLPALFATEIQSKGLSMALHIDPRLQRPLRGDPLRLTQVLINYVGNAVKFSERGTIDVRASMIESDSLSCVIRMEVEDRGMGISPVQVSQLFQSFQQLDGSTARRFGGTGLGLVICKQLAALMGGEVGVTSEVGIGSTFWSTARLGWGEHADLDSAERAQEAHKEVLLGACILVVDDNEMNLEVTASVLRDVGASVTVAVNGQEAIKRMLVQRFDCVLMDVQMPIMDGLQATRLIRTNRHIADTPVIAVTADARIEKRDLCLAAGMSDVLSKPFEPMQLYGKLTQWLYGGVDNPHVLVAPTATDNIARIDSPIDWSVLTKSSGSRPERIERYAKMFVDLTPETLAELDAALAEADLKKLRDLGHRLKSSAKLVGALPLAAACESLEYLGLDATLDQAREKVTHIALMFESAAAEINERTK